jgi:hypothetical protein
VAAMHEATPVAPTAMTTGPDVGRGRGRERATATTAAAPASPTKVTAKTRIEGNASPTVSPVRATVTAPSAAAPTAGLRLRGGGRIDTRAHPNAKRHRSERSRTWASSAVIAAPQWRRPAGSVAVAAARRRAGGSVAADKPVGSARRARRSKPTATIHGVESTRHSTPVSSQ